MNKYEALCRLLDAYDRVPDEQRHGPHREPGAKALRELAGVGQRALNGAGVGVRTQSIPAGRRGPGRSSTKVYPREGLIAARVRMARVLDDAVRVAARGPSTWKAPELIAALVADDRATWAKAASVVGAVLSSFADMGVPVRVVSRSAGRVAEFGTQRRVNGSRSQVVDTVDLIRARDRFRASLGGAPDWPDEDPAEWTQWHEDALAFPDSWPPLDAQRTAVVSSGRRYGGAGPGAMPSPAPGPVANRHAHRSAT